jgi:nitrogen regulatory protein P-II 1
VPRPSREAHHRDHPPRAPPEVKAALFRAGVTGVTLSRVAGHGGEREIMQRYRAETVVLEFHDKVRLEMACSEPFVEPCVQAILSAARTGEVGDGKIFVQPLDQVIRIRTGERDIAALTRYGRRRASGGPAMWRPRQECGRGGRMGAAHHDRRGRRHGVAPRLDRARDAHGARVALFYGGLVRGRACSTPCC